MRQGAVDQFFLRWLSHFSARPAPALSPQAQLRQALQDLRARHAKLLGSLLNTHIQRRCEHEPFPLGPIYLTTAEIAEAIPLMDPVQQDVARAFCETVEGTGTPFVAQSCPFTLTVTNSPP